MTSKETVAATKPQWLSEAETATKIKKGKPVENIRVDALPPVLLDGWRVDRDCLDLIIAALQRSTPEQVHPFILELRRARADRAFDEFAWELLEQWIDAGAAPKQKWAILCVTMLGSEMLLFRLIPFVRKWRVQSFFDRAKFGLECLNASGEKVALSEISEMSYLMSLRSLQNRAREIMERVAKERGITVGELEDRIVPDCGLHGGGTGDRIFDFGTRSFRLIIHNLRPGVMDEDGNKFAMFPAPGARDDARLAEIAMMDWLLVSEILQSIVDAQTLRLEHAMINNRRWTRAEFDEHLMNHPMMTHLIKLLVWGAYDADGKLLGTFRIADDNTFADERDAATILAGCTAVGIIHPFSLPADIRGQWGEIFSDYEIEQLFPQLGRQLFGLEPGEGAQTTMRRRFSRKVSATRFEKNIAALNWVDGTGGPLHSPFARYFSGFDLTAVTDQVPAQSKADPEVVRILFFLKGMRKIDLHFETERLALQLIPPQVISEALLDLTTASLSAS